MGQQQQKTAPKDTFMRLFLRGATEPGFLRNVLEIRSRLENVKLDNDLFLSLLSFALEKQGPERWTDFNV